jgi:hypothetical protein
VEQRGEGRRRQPGEGHRDGELTGSGALRTAPGTPARRARVRLRAGARVQHCAEAGRPPRGGRCRRPGTVRVGQRRRRPEPAPVTGPTGRADHAHAREGPAMHSILFENHGPLAVTCRSSRARPCPERAAGRRSRRCSPVS